MPSRVTVANSHDGEVCVHKLHLPPNTGNEEAAWLARAQHRGVVRLIAHRSEPPVTITAHVAGPTLRMASLSPARAATVLQSLSATLADLHDRDMTHGAVSPDHIIVSYRNDDRRAAAVLCSPTSAATVSDQAGLGECIAWLIAGWTEQAVRVPDGWHRLRDRLLAERPPPLRRVAGQLGHLTTSERDTDVRNASPKRRGHGPAARVPRRSGILVLAGFVAIAILGLQLSSRLAAAPPPRSGEPLAIGGQLFVVGAADDLRVAVPNPCKNQPLALLLDDDGDVWAFDRAIDRTTATRIARVPGATSLVVEETNPCPTLWAVGPAGRVELQL
jgi:hypothetical protein